MNGERGYTLVEMMVATVIIGAIVVVLTLVSHQFFTIPEKSNDKVASLHAIQNVIHWISLDVMEAEFAYGGDNLSLTKPDATEINYERIGDELYRACDGRDILLARSVSSVNFTVEDRLITMNITVAPESRWDISENCTYMVAMRPSEY